MDMSVKSNGCLPIKIEWSNHWNPGTEHCCPVASCPMQSAPVSAPVKCPKLCLFGPCVGTSGSTKPRFRMVSLILLMFTGYLSFILFLLSCVLFFLSSLRMHSSNHTQTYIDTLYIYTTNIFRYTYTTIPWNHFWPSFTNPEGFKKRGGGSCDFNLLGTSAGMVVSTKGVTISEISTWGWRFVAAKMDPLDAVLKQRGPAGVVHVWCLFKGETQRIWV